MATERVQIVVSSKGTVTVRKEIEDIGNTAKKSSGFIDALRNALTLVVGGSAISALIKYSDSATRLGNSLKQTGLEGEAFAQVQDRIYATAIKNGQQAEALAVVYQKLDAVQNQLGISSEQIIGATEGIAAAMKLSTAGTAAQEGALQQLGQLLGGTAVQAQEYNSLIDGAYPLLQAAANGSDQFKGSVAAMTAVIKEGGFSTKTFFQILQNGLASTEAIAASLPLTVGQSLVALQQSFTQFLATSATASTAAKLLAGAIKFIADNINGVVMVLLPFVTLLAINFAVVAVGAAITAVTSLVTSLGALALGFFSLTVAVLTNPLTWVVAGFVAIGVAVAALIIWLTAGSEGFTTLANTAGAAIDRVKKEFSKLIDFGPKGAASIELKGKTAADALKKAGVDNGDTLTKALTDGSKEHKTAITEASTDGSEKYKNAIATAGFDFGRDMGKALEDSGTKVKDVWQKMLVETGQRVGDQWKQAITDGGTAAAEAIAKAMKSGPAAGPGPGYATGGQFMVGGSGGTDTQPVRFMASPNERVTIETPAQQRATDAAKSNARNGSGGSAPTTIINQIAPASVLDAMQTAAGGDIIYNNIESNPDRYRKALGVGA